MGKASSAKKVARAERAGGVQRSSERRPMGYPLVIAAVCLLGIGMVVLARGSREASASPAVGDHWHAAYGVYDCTTDEFEAPFQGTDDPQGIHSHQDGIMHIHPFPDPIGELPGASGNDATFEVWFRAMNASISDEAIVLPDGRRLEAGTTCDGEEAVIQVLHWDRAFAALENGTDPDEIITSDFNSIKFDNDGEAYTIALAPLGADIPIPPTINGLSNLSDLPQQSNVPTLDDVIGEGDAPAEEDAPAEDESDG